MNILPREMQIEGNVVGTIRLFGTHAILRDTRIDHPPVDG
jgi:hypothetical protein